MAVESYGCWGPETQSNFSLISTHLAMGGGGGGGGMAGLSPFQEIICGRQIDNCNSLFPYPGPLLCSPLILTSAGSNR